MTKEKLGWLKRSNEIESYRERKQDIIEDLKLCISYTPNRENDLLAIMEQYIKAEVVERNKILGQLKCCINDEEYENPYALYYSVGRQIIAFMNFNPRSNKSYNSPSPLATYCSQKNQIKTTKNCLMS